MNSRQEKDREKGREQDRKQDRESGQENNSSSNPEKSRIFRPAALERLSSPEQLDQLMQVVTLRSWLPLATLGGLLFCALVWSVLGRIPVTTSGQGVIVRADTMAGAMSDGAADTAMQGMGEELVGVAYFSAGEIAQVRPGMAVLLIPDVQGAQVAGGLMGEVVSVSTPSIATIEAVRQAGLDRTAYVEVIALPNRDDSGHYRWSTRTNMRAPIAGMPAIARVTLKEQAPITFVFPFLE